MPEAANGAGPRDVPFAGLWVYLALAFGLVYALLGVLFTWGDAVTALFGPLNVSNPLFILAVWSPAIAGAAVVLGTTGWRGFGGFLARLFLWRCSWPWALLLVFGIPAIVYAAALIKGAPFALWPFSDAAAALGALGLMLILGPMEEFGWRGVMLPLLQRRMAPIWAGLIVGLIWGIWHLPAFFLSGTPQSNWAFLPFLAGATAVAVILTALFNASRGSLILPMLFHFQTNNPIWPDAEPVDMALYVVAAVVVVWLDREAMFTRAGAATRVTGPGG